MAKPAAQGRVFVVGCTYWCISEPRGREHRSMTVARRTAKVIWATAGERYAVETYDGNEYTKEARGVWWSAAHPLGQRTGNGSC